MHGGECLVSYLVCAACIAVGCLACRWRILSRTIMVSGSLSLHRPWRSSTATSKATTSWRDFGKYFDDVEQSCCYCGGFCHLLAWGCDVVAHESGASHQ